jgi:hypothetical protein
MNNKLLVKQADNFIESIFFKCKKFELNTICILF